MLAVNDTWAKDCDKYFFIKMLTLEASNVSIEDYKTIPVLQPAQLAVEDYKALTSKVYLTIKDVYKRYNNYDWYLKADDDTIIFMDNLKMLLKDKNQNDLSTMGFNIFETFGGTYRSGGAGYILSNGAMKAIGAKLHEKTRFCRNTGTEDADIGDCLGNLEVKVEPSVDDEQRERFHPFSISTHIHGAYPSWIYQMSEYPVKKGRESISETTISFHYVTVKEMRSLYTLWKRYKKLKEKGLKNVTFSSICYQML